MSDDWWTADDALRAHRIVGVGLCSCGDRYSLRYMDYDEWMAEHPRFIASAEGGSDA